MSGFLDISDVYTGSRCLARAGWTRGPISIDAVTCWADDAKSGVDGTTGGDIMVGKLTPGFRDGSVLFFGPRLEDDMKLALITLGLLATTGVVYAACVFC